MFKEKYLNKQKDLSAKNITPPFPKIIKIDICNVCNYSCVFCPQARQHNKIGCIDKDLCYSIIKDSYNAGARELCLSMTGEPLLNMELENYVRYAKAIGYTYVFLNTNGYLLNEERTERLLSAGIDSVKVSVNAARKSYQVVHGVDAFDRVIENIKKFSEIKQQKRYSCSLYVSYIALKPTLEEAGLIKEILASYVDEIVVMNANTRGGSVYEEKSKIYIGEDEFSFQYPCSQLFNNAYVTAEGYMIICCQDFENLTVVADLHRENIVDAWNNKIFTDFRRKYLSHDLTGTLCQNCIYNTSEEVVPLIKEKAYYETSTSKEIDLLKRIKELEAHC